MKYLVLVACSVLAAGVDTGLAATVFPYSYRTETLPNGLKVVLIPMQSPGLVAYYTIVRTGSRDEVEPGKSGFAHFFEHMMFRGTKKYPGPAYDRIVTSIGADANAYTTDDLTAYHLKFAKEDLETVIDIESDRFQNLHYDKAAFQTEAGAVYGEYRKSVTDPFFLLEEKLKDLAYESHTYKHTTMGFEADIKAMPEAYQYSLAFFDRFYRPENTVLLIVGDIDPEATLGLIEKYYGPWKPGYVAPKIVAEPPQTKEKSAEIAYPGQTLPILDVAYKGDAFDPGNRDYLAAVLLGQLAFGRNSEIYRKLVIEEQKAEFIVAQIPMNRDLPLFEILAMVKDAKDLDYVRDAIYGALEQLKTQPVDAKRLGDVKRRHKYSFLMDLDTPDRVAGELARLAALTGGVEVVDQFYSELEKVSPDDIRRAAATYFVPERRTVVVLKGSQP